jgi:hypothetical protein
MNFHEFIFSERLPKKYLRHGIFWLSWWSYFLCTRYLLPQVVPMTQKTAFLKLDTADLLQSIFILMIQMMSCYVFIYILLPRYLLKARYFLFIISIILLGSAVVLVTHLINSQLMPFIAKEVLRSTRPPHSLTYWASIFYGGISSIKIFAAAAALKIGKNWWFKQKEKERLEKEKIDAELQLLKAQIHPAFLFNTLNNIYDSALNASPKAPEMLLKLSEILSYMLYECNDREVFLIKEIKMLEDYMVLEKTKFGDKLDMNMLIKGCNSKEKITPLLLLHFIENSFKQCDCILNEQPWINLEIQIEDSVLQMKLMNGKSPIRLTDETDENNLAQAQRRLKLLYPGTHELKITEEPEIMMVDLRVKLKELQENTVLHKDAFSTEPEVV